MSTLPPPPPPPEPLPTTPQPPTAAPAPPPPAFPTPTPYPTQPPPYPPQSTPFTPQPSASPPAAPTSSSVRLGIIVGVGITLALVVLAGALFALFSALSNTLDATATDDGDDEPTTIVDETPPCDGCLTFDDALELRMPEGVPALDLTFDEETGYTKPSIVGAYADSSVDTYESGGGAPDGCSFAIDYSPVSPTSPNESNRTDRVADLGSFYGDADYLSLVARVFATDTDAAAYPESLRAGLAACPHYSFSFSDGADFWSTDTQPLDFATSSSAVTAVGWHESYNGSELFIVDLQHSNLAVRAIYNLTGDSAGAEEEFRTFVLEMSSALEALSQ